MRRIGSICVHESREAIDKALLDNASLRAVACRFDVARARLQRHQANHLAPMVAEAMVRREELNASDPMSRNPVL